MKIRDHSRLIVECRKAGHPAFKPKRKVIITAGVPYSYRICVRCGSGVDPQRVSS